MAKINGSSLAVGMLEWRDLPYREIGNDINHSTLLAPLGADGTSMSPTLRGASGSSVTKFNPLSPIEASRLIDKAV